MKDFVVQNPTNWPFLSQFDWNFGNWRALKIVLHNATIQVFRSRRVEPNSRFYERATPTTIPDQPGSVLNTIAVFLFENVIVWEKKYKSPIDQIG